MKISILTILPFVSGLPALAQDKKPPKDPTDPKQIVLDRSSFLRTAVKAYAVYLGSDPAKGELVMRKEGEAEGKAFAIDPDAEVRVRGYWGGLGDLVPGDRVWTWTRVGPDGKPRALIMVADEISEQDIHQIPWELVSADPEKREVAIRRTLDRKNEQTRTLKAAAALGLAREGEDAVFRGGENPIPVKPGGLVFVRTTGPELLEVARPEDLAAIREAQKARLEERWRKEGLPGTIGAFHPLTGELEVVLDHEAIRWGRSLKPNDRVRILQEKPIHAAVLEMRPWNERTRVTMAVSGRELADLAPGRRVRLGIEEPSAEARASKIPPDAGRLKDASARAEWFLASTYCTCSIAGDV